QAFSGAAGVPVVLGAVRKGYLRRAAGSTGWPFTRWLRKLRPDPMRRLRLDPANRAQQALRGRGAQPELEATLARTSLPQATTTQRAQVDLALRALARQVGGDLPQRWAMAVREAANPGHDEVGDALDQAIAAVDLDYRKPLWWSLFGVLQLVAALAAIAGLIWLIGIAVVAWLQLPEFPLPEWHGFPYPTLMLVGGLLAGLVLAGLARVLAGIGANRRRRLVEGHLHEAVGTVADHHVLEPVREVLGEHRVTRQALSVGS
ncbi:MAG: ABC transporter, partial [Micrococcales bacterium]